MGVGITPDRRDFFLQIVYPCQSDEDTATYGPEIETCLTFMLVEKEGWRLDITGGLRFAWEASGNAEIEGGGLVSTVSVSEEDASMSMSVPEFMSAGRFEERIDEE